MLRVKAIPGEPCRFWCESNSLICVNAQCSALYNRRWRHRPEPGATAVYLHVGDLCPKCGSQLDLRFHVCDISAYNCSGRCGCEFFQFNLEPKVSRLSPAEQGMGQYRCSHIIACRDFALDLALKGHEAARLRWAGRQTEEAQP